MDSRPPGQLTEVRASAQLFSAGESDVRGAAARPVSFETLYDAHVDFVWRNAQRLGVAEEALDDVVQQVFLVVHRRLPEVATDLPVKAWVFGILSHVVRDYRRGRRRKSPHHSAPPIDPATIAEPPGKSPFETLARSEALKVVIELLSELSDDKREIFVLSELEQLNAQEIATLLGVNPNTVYSRLRVARQDFERAAERARSRDTWRLR
ncbi:MAG TPA: sigma-70 family RNA polymerase sigma factor [Polyangiaceae bacterium]|nr:sigma-70 family RNA polymerase sigma factor [Polyangiaceae bacterium]